MFSIIFLVIATLILCAVFTPIIYSSIIYFYPALAWPYSRVFDRVFLVVLIILLILFRKEFSLKNLISKFKIKTKKENIKSFLISFSITTIVSLILICFLDMQGELVWKKKDLFSYFIPKVIKAFFAGVLISVLEESIFRVILFEKFKKGFSLVLSITLTSACYTIAHFIKPNKSFEYTSFSIAKGFEYYKAVMEGMYFDGIIYDMLGLFLVGIILCILIQRFSNIYINIGLHSGWILIMKIFIYLTGEAPNVVMHEMKRRYFLLAQPLSWISVILVFLITYYYFKKREKTK